MASKTNNSSAVQKKKRSREAARQRRGQQNDEFSVLAAQLPLLPNVSSQLDRLCVMKLTNSFIKMKHISKGIIDRHDGADVKTEPVFADMEASMIQALGGFLLVITEDGHCLYVSPSVMQFLGLPQLEMIGDSIYKYVHPCDQAELAKQLGGQVPLEDMEIFDGLFSNENEHVVSALPKRAAANEQSSSYRSVLLRMKSTITSRGKSVNLNASIFRVVHCMGTILPFQTKCRTKTDSGLTNCLLAVGTPLLCQATFEVPLDRQTFTTKHSLDLKVLFCDEKIKDLLGYEDSDMVGKSWYSAGHVCDINVIKCCHSSVMTKGQAVSGYYRIMSKSGGWLWLQTKGSMVYSTTTCQPLYILCINHVVSGLEGENNILSIEQSLSAAKRVSSVDNSPVLAKKPRIAIEEACIPLCLSGSDDLAALIDQEKEYNDTLAEFYTNMPLPEAPTIKEETTEDDDFDDDLPSLEFLDGDEYVPLDDFSDDLMNDEEFLLRAPFIPPPPVDEVLTDFPLDESFLNDVADEDNIDDHILAARAPFIPPPCIDTLLFDDLDDFVSGTSSTKPNSPYFSPSEEARKEGKAHPRLESPHTIDKASMEPLRLVNIGNAAVPSNLVSRQNLKRKAEDQTEFDDGSSKSPNLTVNEGMSMYANKNKSHCVGGKDKAILLPLITNTDAEMNAPSYSLLQGCDLFSALDQLYVPRLR